MYTSEGGVYRDHEIRLTFCHFVKASHCMFPCASSPVVDSLSGRSTVRNSAANITTKAVARIA